MAELGRRQAVPSVTVPGDSGLSPGRGGWVQRRVSGFPPSRLLWDAFLVGCLIIFGAWGMTAEFANSKKNPRKSCLAQPEPFCGH